MKRIAVFTSGGDAPGMNACIRAVVRTAIYRKVDVLGIKRGYIGMISGDFVPMEARSVSNIIQRGGTIIETGRAKEFRKKDGRRKAASMLKKHHIDGLIAIGGDGTFHGAEALYKEWGIPIVGVPGTIDNDLYGTDFTIGFDTAVNTAMQAVDKIRDTASAHERLFMVEVMGRNAGFIGLDVGISCGAEETLIPETKTDITAICKRLAEGRKRGKTSSIIIVSEGDEAGGVKEIGEKLKQHCSMDYKICILGHIQRGGSPTVRDRLLASKLGSAAVIGLLEGRKNVMAGETAGRIRFTPLRHTWAKKKKIDRTLLRAGRILSK